MKNFHTLSQAEEIVARYHEAVTGKPAEMLGGSGAENGELLIVFEGEFLYFIDPFTLEGHDAQGRPIDYDAPPVLPENARSLETLTEWALKDHSDKTGRTDGDAIARITLDGTVEISIFQPASAYDPEMPEFEETVYTVDPVTATGFDQDQNPIDLPKTGSNDPGAAAAAGLALLLTFGGAGISWVAEKRRKQR